MVLRHGGWRFEQFARMAIDERRRAANTKPDDSLRLWNPKRQKFAALARQYSSAAPPYAHALAALLFEESRQHKCQIERLRSIESRITECVAETARVSGAFRHVFSVISKCIRVPVRY